MHRSRCSMTPPRLPTRNVNARLIWLHVFFATRLINRGTTDPSVDRPRDRRTEHVGTAALALRICAALDGIRAAITKSKFVRANANMKESMRAKLAQLANRLGEIDAALSREGATDDLDQFRRLS